MCIRETLKPTKLKIALFAAAYVALLLTINMSICSSCIKYTDNCGCREGPLLIWLIWDPLGAIFGNAIPMFIIFPALSALFSMLASSVWHRLSKRKK